MTARTLPELLSQSARAFGERPAVASREGLRTRTLSYVTLDAAAGAVAGHLAGRHGLRRGDRVILMVPGSIRAVAALFGLFRAGLVAVPLDLGSTAEFVHAVARSTGATVMICGPGAPVPEGVARIALEDLPLDGAGAEGPVPGPQDPAQIVFTSGTTGAPKGVTLTHGNIMADVHGTAEVVPPDEEMRLVSILPLSHMFEQTVGLYLPLLKGGTVRYAPSLRPSVIAAEMRRHRATGMVVVPRVLSLLMAAAEDRADAAGRAGAWARQHRIAARLPMRFRRFLFWPLHRAFGSRLRYFLCGGAPLAPDLMCAWERTGVRVIEGYGATECAPVIASNRFDDRVPGRVGRPLTGVDLRLSEDGEVQVRGPNVFAGYWQDDARTAAAFTADGWYRTDDIAEIDAGGRLRIVARLSDRIVLSSGMNVYPADVEAVLARQPGVRECVVLGLPGPHGGDRLHAVIRPADGADAAAVATAVERANALLASHQKIAGMTLWHDEFPKTALQKVKRKALRQALDGQHGDRGEPAPEPPGDRAAALLRGVLRRAPAALSPGMRLGSDLGLDSLGRVELATQVESETGRDVPEETIASLVTVADLAALLERPGPQATPMRFPEWPWGRGAEAVRRVAQPLLLFLPHRLFARPFRVTGREALDGLDAPALFIANHASHADTLALLRALPARLRHRTAVAAAADYFFARRWTAGPAALVLGAFPFSRQGRVRESLEYCGELADAGWSILIYPEGTRSPDGRLLPFKSGIGLLATGLGVPVVPVAVTGGARVLPKGAGWPRRAAVSVRFGPPVTVPPDMPPAEATPWLRRLVADLLEAEERSTADG